MRWVRAVAGEPLVHFVLVGSVLWGVYGRLWPEPLQRISVPAPVEAGLVADFTRRLGRAPTDTERATLVSDFVDDEVLYREALAQGLDRGDVIIRRRLIQKMGFVLENTHGPGAEPTTAVLAAYLDAHAAQYRLPARLSLRHVFVSFAQHGAESEKLAAVLRVQLAAGADATRLGDPFVHGGVQPLLSESELAARFGTAFARQVQALPAGMWSAPVASSYGLHLVLVTAREASRQPSLSEIRERVLRDYNEEQRASTRRRVLDELRARYDVRVAPLPAPACAACKSARGAASGAAPGVSK